MNISGAYVFNATAQEVWTVLMDPKALAQCIPGCTNVSETGLGRYRATVNVAMGPFDGRYQLEVTLKDLVPVRCYCMAIEGIGSAGFLSAETRITLEEDRGKTTLSMAGAAEARGIMGRMAEGLAGGKSQEMLDRFFGCVQKMVGQPTQPS
jgi:carbon monoxide dehydrogenase subunit G